MIMDCQSHTTDAIVNDIGMGSGWHQDFYPKLMGIPECATDTLKVGEQDASCGSNGIAK
jgi:hypothetical protein